MHIVTRREVIQILRRWLAGDLSPGDVHDWAVNRYAAHTYEAEDDVVNEVLGRLDMLDVDLTVVNDIPAFLDVLSLPPDRSHEAGKILDQQWHSIDLDERRRIC